MDDDWDHIELCLCVPCLIFYIGGYIEPDAPETVYPRLAKRGFNRSEQEAIGEEWYEVCIELHCTIIGYANGDPIFKQMDFGCVWHQPGRNINIARKVRHRPDVLPAQWARMVCVAAIIVDDTWHHQPTEATRTREPIKAKPSPRFPNTISSLLND